MPGKKTTKGQKPKTVTLTEYQGKYYVEGKSKEEATRTMRGVNVRSPNNVAIMPPAKRIKSRTVRISPRMPRLK